MRELAVILGIVISGLSIIKKWDAPLPLKRRDYFCILVSAFGMKIVMMTISMNESKSNKLLLHIIGGCLLFACVTDMAIYHVYNFTWWIAVTAAAIIFWRALLEVKVKTPEETIISLIVFMVIQINFFCKTYGKADGYAFCVCAVTEAARGMKMTGYLLHMVTAYTLLFLVQISYGNLNKRGNLKKPVPFLPYITISYLLIMVLEVIFKCKLNIK